MDDKERRVALRKELRERFGKNEIPCKYKVKYPINAERKYQNLIQKVMQPVKDSVVDYLEQLRALLEFYTGDEGEFVEVRYEKQRRKLRRRRRIENLNKELEELEDLFAALELDIISREADIDFRYEIEQISEMVQKLNQTEWEKAVKETLDTDVPAETYYEQLHRKDIAIWVDDNTEWTSRIPGETLAEIRGIVYSEYLEGRTVREIVEDIKLEYTASAKRNKALVINRVANINTEITKQKHQDAGIHDYIWWTRLDERVRKSHRRLHGKKFSWDDPPETDGGRRCHPGEDYGCRCIALPSFSLNTIEL